MRADEARVLYLRWLSRASPSAYRAAMASVTGDGSLGVDWGAIIGAVTTAATTVIAKQQQDKALDLQKKQLQLDAEQKLQAQLLTVNTQRAQAGLPPVDKNGVVIPGAQLPAPSSVLQQAARAVGITSTSPALESSFPWLLAGGVALVAFILLR